MQIKKIVFFIFLLSVITTIAQAQQYETNSSASSNFSANDFDTTDYAEIPVVKKIEDCFGNSYVYYFTVGKTRFRAVHIFVDTFPQTITIQKFYNKKWYNRLAFQTQNHYGGFKLKGVNNDEFADLVRSAYFTSEVYFYNPTINNFIDSVCCEINYDIHLLDSAHHIYCDFQELRMMCGQLSSTLYKIENYKKTLLYNVELVNCDSTGEHILIKTLILNKCINGNEDELEEIATIHLTKPLDQEKDNYFNNKAFWAKRYMKLLGYK